MATPYEKIYENILPKFKSYEIPQMTEEEVLAELRDYLQSAIVTFSIYKDGLDDRDEDLQQFNIDLSDMEIEILANYALIEYIDSNYIRTPHVLKKELSSTDFNNFSSANFLGKLESIQNHYISENEKLVSRYSWTNKEKAWSSLGNGYKKK